MSPISLHVLINVLPLNSPITGVGRYTYYLAKSLRDQFPDFRYSYYSGKVMKNFPELTTCSTDNQKLKTLKRLIKRIPFSYHLKEMLYTCSKFFVRESYDVYIEPNFIPVRGIRAKKTIVVIHDFSFYLYPQWHPEERVKFFSRNFWREIQRADVIVFVSKTILEEASRLGLNNFQKVVIYPGIDHDKFRPLSREEQGQFELRLKLPERFILYVGTLEPRKNLITLLSAYAQLPENIRKSYPMVLAGFEGWKNREIFENIRKYNVLYLGYVSDEELCFLYNRATLFVYPSLYEGFGFPPLEAMACSCPVLVSDIPVFREVYGDTALYFDPGDSENLSYRLKEILEDEERILQLKQVVRNRALMYSWQSCANEFYNLMLKILS